MYFTEEIIYANINFLEKYKKVNAHLSILVLNLNTKEVVVFSYTFLEFFLCKDIY